MVLFSAQAGKINKILPPTHTLLPKNPYIQEKEISSSNIKKTVISLKRKLFLHFWKWNPALFNPGLKKKKKKKKKKKTTQRKFTILKEKETSKKFIIFSQKKAALIF